MSGNSKYCNFLLNESKKGRTNCYIDLCSIGLRKVFPLVFELVPIRKEAAKISSEVFLIGLRNINKIQNVNEFEKLISRIIILKCVNYLVDNNLELLDDTDITNLSEDFKSSFSDIEKEILKLSSIERVVIVLCDQIGQTVEIVDEIYKGINLKEIVETLNNVRQKLIIKFPSKNKLQFSSEYLKKIDANPSTTEKVDAQETKKNKTKLLPEQIEYCKELLNNLFVNLEPDSEIIENLRISLLKEETNKMLNKKVSVDEKEILNSEKLLKKNQKIEKFIHKRNRVAYLLAKYGIKSKSILKMAISVGISVIILIAFLMIANIPEAWIISKDDIIATVNGINTKTIELSESDIITTSNNRRTKLEKGEHTSIEIFENSEFVISKVTSSENVFELNSGSLKFNSTFNSQKDFNEFGIYNRIKTPISTIVTENSNFLYSIIKSNGFDLEVERGLVSLKIDNSSRMVYCGSNYNLKYDDSYSLVIPYHKNSSEDFINAIEQISKVPTDIYALNYILRNTEEKDILTLWHLLSISDFQKKKLVLEKLNQILLLEINTESSEEMLLSEETKQDLLDFIISDLLIMNDEWDSNYIITKL